MLRRMSAHQWALQGEDTRRAERWRCAAVGSPPLPLPLPLHTPFFTLLLAMFGRFIAHLLCISIYVLLLLVLAESPSPGTCPYIPQDLLSWSPEHGEAVWTAALPTFQNVPSVPGLPGIPLLFHRSHKYSRADLPSQPRVWRNLVSCAELHRTSVTVYYDDSQAIGTIEAALAMIRDPDLDAAWALLTSPPLDQVRVKGPRQRPMP